MGFLQSLAISSFLLPCILLPAQTEPPLSGDQIIERASPAVVLILAGSGDGKLTAIGSGLIVRPDGIVLTANHVVKGMKEVQIRLKNGEVYDRVEMVAADERRDIAALRIPGTDLPVLPVANSSNIRAGAAVFAVSNGAGLPWTASSGVISAVRTADEVPGAGSGYRLLQFTAPLSPGSSGGVLVDAQAHALAIVVGFLSAGQNVNFAIPLDSIVGMASVAGGAPFASGAQLQLPSAGRPGTPSSPGFTNVPQSVPQIPSADQLQIKTVSVYSKTIYLRRERFQDDLRQHPLFRQLGLRLADYGQTADVAVTVDRPFLTFDWTYILVFQPGNLTLATGTGKTFIAFQIAWKLFHSRWNLGGEPTRRPRILFLADRNILADQAYNAFSAFPEDALVRIAPGDIRKKGKVPKNGSIFFTIFQTFMSGPPREGHPSPYFGE